MRRWRNKTSNNNIEQIYNLITKVQNDSRDKPKKYSDV